MDARTLLIPALVVLLILSSGCTSPAPSPVPATATTGPVSVTERTAPATPGELVEYVNDADVYYQRVGKERAIREFNDPDGSFARGEVYVWAFDFNGTCLANSAHPDWVGQDRLNITDDTGFRRIMAMRDAALAGGGFVTYRIENPVTGATGQKLSYVKRADDTWWFGSGIYGGNQTVPEDSPAMVRQELAAKVDDAVRFAQKDGKAPALAAFNNASGPFAAGGTYIFAFDMNGTTLAMPFEPDRIGRNERALTDSNGIAIGERKIALAGEGGGFFYYVFTDPASGKPAFKVSYVKPVDSTWAVGAGRYLPGVPAGFAPDERDALAARVNEAVAYVNANGRDAALREFGDPNGTFSEPDRYIFAFGRDGTSWASPYFPGIAGTNRMASRDAYGEYPVPYLIANAEQGGGFLYYFSFDPANDYRTNLYLAYARMAGDDLVVGSGIPA